METRDLLFEIGMEEIPAKFMPMALQQLQELAEKCLQAARLTFKGVRTYGTPRRLVLLAEGVGVVQQDLQVAVKGPALKAAFDSDGQPTKAALGFARSQRVAVTALEQREVGKVAYVFAVRTEGGQAATAVLPGLLQGLVNGLNFPKPMRWGWNTMRFVRPIRWLLALFGDAVLTFEVGGVVTGRITYGHRFLAGAPITINEPAEYLAKLEQAYVIVDQNRRRKSIWEQVTKLAVTEGGGAVSDADLLEEITYLVEYPTALCGRIDAGFMHLPQPVLVTPMKEHQRYFPVQDRQGRLLPKFIAVRNGTAEHLAVVQAGNEKVLRARLADAAFFYAEDQKTPFAEQTEKLKKIVFQESLGTVFERVEREQRLTAWLADHLQVSLPVKERSVRAALLAKTDLVSLMVYEFPELQGIMGEKYALLNGEDPVVAQAIREHYQPRFAGDAVPEITEGNLVALADKLDVLVGCFGIGIVPTGSQDPYALRRQALGICQIVIQANLPLSLSQAIQAAYNGYLSTVKLTRSLAEVQADLAEFFRQRLRYLLGEQEISFDVIEAVLAADADQPADVYRRTQALVAFRHTPTFESLFKAYTRAANLAKKAGEEVVVREELLGLVVERELYVALQQARQEIMAAGRDYGRIFQVVAGIGPAVDAFFDGVMVMAEETALRENRLALLKLVAGLLVGIADLSKIVD
ncbi:MAG: glycine--tRNA ligase subunit beta [Heliobacteriaceae bacterium]|nr:glycine--tRNA ligase subunit beta [Heliobacteriaceae bacterium]